MGSKHIIEYSLKLIYSRIHGQCAFVCYPKERLYRLAKAGETGAKTVFDIASDFFIYEDAGQFARQLL